MSGGISQKWRGRVIIKCRRNEMKTKDEGREWTDDVIGKGSGDYPLGW